NTRNSSEDGARFAGHAHFNALQGLWLGPLVPRLHEPPALERGPAIVRILRRALGHLHLFLRQFLVRDQAEQMTYAIEARALLISRGHNIPGRKLGVRGLEHDVSSTRVFVPFFSRTKVRRAQFPLP